VDVKPPFAAEGRNLHAVTHLALLGVKMQEPAFWVDTKDEGGHRPLFFDFSLMQ